MGRHIKYPEAKQALLDYYKEHGKRMPTHEFFDLLKEEGAVIALETARSHKANYYSSFQTPLDTEAYVADTSHLANRTKCNTVYTADSFLAEIIWESIHHQWFHSRENDITKNGAYLSACAHGWNKAKFEDFATFEDISKTALMHQL